MAGRFSVEAVFKAVDRITAPVTRMQNRVGKFTRSMNRGLRAVNKSLNKVVGGLAKGAKAALKFAGAGLGVVTAGVTLLIREFSKIENAEAAFTPLLRGAKKAKEMVQALNDTAASTPFQFETLAKATEQLLPVMNGNIQLTIKTLRMLGDTAGGNAQKLESITRGFTKAMLKGKVDMESLNMIAEAGVPIFTELADSMGTKVNKAFFKMISAGKITTVQLTKAFEKMTDKGGIFFGGMEIASKTTTGLFSTLKDNISLTAAELGGVLAPTVKELIRGATDVARKIRTWVKNNRELISAKFTKFIESAKNAIKKLVNAIQTLNDENSVFERLKKFITILTDAVIFLGQHGATIAKIIAGIVALSLVLKTLSVVMGIVNLVMAANPLGLIVLGIAALILAIGSLIFWWDDLKAAFMDFTAPVRALLVDFFEWFFAIPDRMAEAVSDMATALKRLPGLVGKALSDLNPLREFGASIGSGLFDLLNDSPEINPGSSGPQVVSPQERVARSIEEQRTTSTAEVTIRDESGRAEVSGGKLGPGLNLLSSGAF